MNTKTDETKCREYVYRGTWSGRGHCCRKTWKDGYCKQHHPDTVAARCDVLQKRREELRKKSPYYLLGRANERIAELTGAWEAALKTLDGEWMPYDRTAFREACDRARAVIDGQNAGKDGMKP